MNDLFEDAGRNRADRTDGRDAVDPLLAAQLYDCPRYDTWPGEMRLALAVLEDAIATVRLTTGIATARARRLARDAALWIASRDTMHPYAFENLCDHLGLNAAWIRSGLRKPTGRRDTRSPYAEPVRTLKPRNETESGSAVKGAIAHCTDPLDDAYPFEEVTTRSIELPSRLVSRIHCCSKDELDDEVSLCEQSRKGSRPPRCTSG